MRKSLLAFLGLLGAFSFAQKSTLFDTNNSFINIINGKNKDLYSVTTNTHQKYGNGAYTISCNKIINNFTIKK